MAGERWTAEQVAAYYRRHGWDLPPEIPFLMTPGAGAFPLADPMRKAPENRPSRAQVPRALADKGVDTPQRATEAARGQKRVSALLPPGAAMGTQLPLRLRNEKSSHAHWAKRRGRVQFERQYVYEHLTSLWEDGPLLGLPLVVTITRIAPRALDGDNLQCACSATRDAISDWLAGQYLKGNDRQDRLEWRYEQRYVCPQFYAVEIRVERPNVKQVKRTQECEP